MICTWSSAFPVLFCLCYRLYVYCWIKNSHGYKVHTSYVNSFGYSGHLGSLRNRRRCPSTCFLEHMVLLVCRTHVCVCKNWATKCSQSLCICCCLWVLAVVRDGVIGYRKYNPLSHIERKNPLCLTTFKSFISSCSCYIIWVHAATETIESTLSKSTDFQCGENMGRSSEFAKLCCP